MRDVALKPLKNTPPKKLVAADLFSGSGAVTAALKQSGFKIAFAVDNNPTACETYRRNHGEVILREGDIRRITPSKLPAIPVIDLLVVCAPCQPFSSQNRKRGEDPRSNLVLESIKFIQKLSPKLVFFENVPGLASSNVFIALERRLHRLGYLLSKARTFDAADFGVPQRRNRCVLMASKSRSAIKYFNKFKPLKSRKTVREAIGDLPPLKAGESDPVDKLHKARNHQEIVLDRLKHIPKDGGSRSSLPPQLWLPCHRRVDSNNSYPDVYGRMSWCDVAPTLTTGCTDVTKGRFAHPEQDRAITLREAAILQGFPRKYKFAGNSSNIATQIGNAVPVGFVEGLAPVMKRMISMARVER